MEYFLIITICLVSGLVQGAAGFGFGLVSMAILGMLMDLPQAAALNVLAALALNIFMYSRLRGHFSLHRIWPLAPAIIAGVPLGVLILTRASGELLNLLLAFVLVLAGTQTLLRERLGKIASHPWHPLYLGVPCGLFAGALSGAYGTGGPPLVAFVFSQGFDRLRYAATLQLLFMLAGFIRLSEMWRHGLLTEQALWLPVSGALAAIIGCSLGLLLLHRIPEILFRRMIALILLILASRYIIMLILT